MDRAQLFNNAGVRLLEAGNSRVALELFRGALELKLAQERIAESSSREQEDPVATTSSSSSSPSVISDDNDTDAEMDDSSSSSSDAVLSRCVTPESVRLADDHLTRIDSYVNQSQSNSNDAQQDHQIESGLAEPIIPYSSRGFHPYLYLHPFSFPSHESPAHSSGYLSNIIILTNLGIAYHKANRFSRKAADFYKLAAMILATEPISRDTAMLRVALMNNFGVWCYENGDGSVLRTCMEHLSLVLDRTSQTDLDSDLTESVRTNIRQLLCPPNGASPAA